MYAMLDFETLGSDGDTICVSLGVVPFNREKILGKKLFLFDLEEQVRLGRSFTADTLKWWMHPNRAEARKVFYSPTQTPLLMADFFVAFEKFIDDCLAKVGENRSDLRPVGNGANFDVVILEHLYRTVHPKGRHAIPFKFWNVWCFRTLEHVHSVKKLHARPHGTHHTADEDALYQAECMRALLNKKTKKKPQEEISESDF